MDIEYTEDAKDDVRHLDRSKQLQVIKAIQKVSQNPLPRTEGGYGKPLSNKHGTHLSHLLKIKVSDIRVVYSLDCKKDTMLIVVVAKRDDFEVYNVAEKRSQ